MKWLRRLLGGLVLWRLFAPPLHPAFRPPQEHPWRLGGRTVFVADQEFLVRETGPVDGRPLVLIHGLGGSSLSEWYQIGPKLAAERRVIMIDHRSHGLSPAASSRYEVEDVADDIAGILDELGLGVVDVAGFSMGGTIAQALAHRHPGRVRRLALIATFAVYPVERRVASLVGAVVTRAWERLTGLGTPEVRTTYLLATGAVERKHARWLWEETHRRNPDAGAQATLALLRFDSRPWVGRLEAETLVVIPGRDQLIPPSWQYGMAGLIPGVEVVELPGAHHEVVWTHPERLTDELTAFLA
ncbi:MAG TPA: alpha/beta fold hydrolase [Acidimicrobiia bacterium]